MTLIGSPDGAALVADEEPAVDDVAPPEVSLAEVLLLLLHAAPSNAKTDIRITAAMLLRCRRALRPVRVSADCCTIDSP
jgi:hypothetical protein